MADSRRTEMTKLLFRTALIELIQEKPFHKITVKEICEQADLNRTTFYLHYSDLNQLLGDIVSQLEKATSEHFSSSTGKGDDVENLIRHLDYIKDNKTIYKAIMSSNLDDNIRMGIFQNMLSGISERVPEFDSKIENPYTYTFMIFGCGSVISKWISNGFDMDSASLARLLYDLCAKPREKIVSRPVNRTRKTVSI